MEKMKKKIFYNANGFSLTNPVFRIIDKKSKQMRKTMTQQKMKGFTLGAEMLWVILFVALCMIGFYIIGAKVILLNAQKEEFSWFVSIIKQKSNIILNNDSHQLEQKEKNSYQVISSPTVRKMSPISIFIIKNDFTLIKYQGLYKRDCEYALQAWSEQKQTNIIVSLNGENIPQNLSKIKMENKCLDDNNLFLISDKENAQK